MSLHRLPAKVPTCLHALHASLREASATAAASRGNDSLTQDSDQDRRKERCCKYGQPTEQEKVTCHTPAPLMHALRMERGPSRKRSSRKDTNMTVNNSPPWARLSCRAC